MQPAPTMSHSEDDVDAMGIVLNKKCPQTKTHYDDDKLCEILKLVLRRPNITCGCLSKVRAMMMMLQECSDCCNPSKTWLTTVTDLDIPLKDLVEFYPNVATDTRKRTVLDIGDDDYSLLNDVFPAHVSRALRAGRKVEPESHDMVTIVFCDIVGFTGISATLSPMKVSHLLDRLYTAFDALSRKHEEFKVETIGDSWMGVTNLTEEQPDHAKRIAAFSMDAVAVAKTVMVDVDDPGLGYVDIRVGVHSGPVVASVVGSRNPRYCLFGDSVNTASRMESHSFAGRIQCSEVSGTLLQRQDPALKLRPRGLTIVKGKGHMHTFWINENPEISN